MLPQELPVGLDSRLRCSLVLCDLIGHSLADALGETSQRRFFGIVAAPPAGIQRFAHTAEEARPHGAPRDEVFVLLKGGLEPGDFLLEERPAPVVCRWRR